MENSLVLKRKETLTCATTWLDTEGIELSEISQSQKDKCLIWLTWDTQSSQTQRDRKEVGMGSWGLMGTEFQFYKMGRVLWIDGGDGSSPMWMSLRPPNCTLKHGSCGEFYVMCVSPQFEKRNFWYCCPSTSVNERTYSYIIQGRRTAHDCDTFNRIKAMVWMNNKRKGNRLTNILLGSRNFC